jgi:hypothetical protein
MYGRMRAMWPMSELVGWPSADRSDVLRETVLDSPADVLVEHLGLTQRMTAEVQDMYSRPIPAPLVTIVPRDAGPKWQHPEPITEPDLDAA